jgi:hypothetical protein
MRIVSCLCLAVTFATSTASTCLAADKPETPHLAFVTEYIRELTAIENIRASAEQEPKPKPDTNETLSNAIYMSTRIQIELRSQIKMLQGMRLNPPFDTLIPNLVGFYTHKIALHQRLIDVSSAFTEGPKPGVDYGKLSTELPKIRAGLDDVDHTLFQASSLVFATLIDMKPDSKNHVSHLIITKAERKNLIISLTTNFGSKLDEKEQDFMVASASVLKGDLLKDYKCSEERWE